jgi:membrane protease YdiL (CAAX protease family)
MTSLILDRAGRLRTVPPFLALETAPPSWSRMAAYLAMAIPGALAATLVVGLLVSLAAAAGLAQASHKPLLQALNVLLDSGRTPRPLASYAYELSVAGLSSFAAAAVALWIAARVYRRPIRSFLTAAGRFRWRVVGAGLLIGLPLTALAALLEASGAGDAPLAPILSPAAGLAGRAVYFAAAVVFLYLAAFAEEAIFRGWLLQQTAARTRNLALILGVNGVLFSLAHFDPNPASFLVRAVMGAGWAWIALRTAGVEFTTGAHLANNLFVALFVAPVTFTAPKPHPFDLRPALIELAVVVALAAVVEVRLRRRPASPER